MALNNNYLLLSTIWFIAVNSAFAQNCETNGVTMTSCVSAGSQIADPADETKYYICLPDSSCSTGYQLYSQQCPAGRIFDPNPVAPGCITPTTTTTTTSATTTTTTPRTTTSTTSSPGFTCTSEGKFPDANNCTKYNQCLYVFNAFYVFSYTCPPNSFYDATTLTCVVGICPSVVSPTTLLTTTAATTSKTTPLPDATTAQPIFTCPAIGLFQDPKDCTKYYRCFSLNDIFYSFNYYCPNGTFFDDIVKLCSQGCCNFD